LLIWIRIPNPVPIDTESGSGSFVEIHRPRGGGAEVNLMYKMPEVFPSYVKRSNNPPEGMKYCIVPL
jgi:hypothetical protein